MSLRELELERDLRALIESTLRERALEFCVSLWENCERDLRQK